MQFTLYNDEFITMEQVIQKRITEYGNINKKKKILGKGNCLSQMWGL